MTTPRHTPASPSARLRGIAERFPVPDDPGAELSDEDLEQVAGGLTRRWEVPTGPAHDAAFRTPPATADPRGTYL